MSHTLDAIQAKLAPKRLTDDAKGAAIETLDHVVEDVKEATLETVERVAEDVKTTAHELSELASVAAMEAVDHALDKLREALPDVNQQAQAIARETIDHALAEAKSAVRELGVDVRTAVRDATLGKVERMTTTTASTTKSAGSSTIATIKQNPGPAALTALGIGWLVLSGKRNAAHTQAGTSVQSSTVHDVSAVGGQVHAAASTASATVGDVAGQIGQTTSQVAGQAKDMASGVVGQTQQVTGKLTDQVAQTPNRLRHRIEENPVPLGILGMALGGAVAMMLPETQRERSVLGEARDSLVQTARSSTQSTMERAQGVIQQAGETLEQELKGEGAQ
jgi:hypothetical protein